MNSNSVTLSKNIQLKLKDIVAVKHSRTSCLQNIEKLNREFPNKNI